MREDFRFYFVLGGTAQCAKELYEVGVRHFLISYAYADEVRLYTDAFFLEHPEAMSKCSLMFDSGAYSAWSRGMEIDVEDYADYCKRLRDKFNFKNMYFINLDKIPGKPHTTPTMDDIKEAVEISEKNAEYLRGQGLDVMEVFHQDDEQVSWNVLYKMLRRSKSPYIGISPSNDVDRVSKYKWMEMTYDEIFNKFPDLNVRTHGFGVTSISIMRKLLLTSADSSSYGLATGYGTPIVFDPVKVELARFDIGTKKFGGEGGEENLIRRLNKMKDAGLLPPFLDDINKVHNYEYSYIERMKCNAWAFLQAQRWINEHQEPIYYTLSLLTSYLDEEEEEND